MTPDLSVFENCAAGFRGLSWPGHEYLLGTDAAHSGIVANLPAGEWTVTRYDVLAKSKAPLATDARGRMKFNSPGSRAVLFHFKRNKRK